MEEQNILLPEPIYVKSIHNKLEFYGIGINMYGSYVVFYVFMLVSSLVLVPGMKV